MALALTWGGRVDTDIHFSEFFAGSHTVSVRFMLQFMNAYSGPMIAVHGRGTYYIGYECRWHCPYHPYTVIAVRIGSGSLEFEIPPGFRETWHHLAVVRKGTTCTVYLDAAPQGTLTLSASDNPVGTLRLGRSEEAHQQFYGFLDDVGVFTAALPESRVSVLSRAPMLTGAELRLLAGFVFGGAEGSTRPVPAILQRPLEYVPGARNVALSRKRNAEADRKLLPLSLVSYMRLPFGQGVARVAQGFCGTLSHHDYAVFAYDLDFPWATADTTITASAPGLVSHVEDGHGDYPGAESNYVTIEQAAGEFCDYHHVRNHGFKVAEQEAVSCGTELARVGMVHQALTNLGEHKRADGPFVTIPLPYCNYEYSDNCGATWHHAIRGYPKEGQLLRNHAPTSPIRYTAAWMPGVSAERQVYDVPYERFREEYDKLYPEGWRIHLLSIVVVDQVPLYTAVFRPGSYPETPIHGRPYGEYRTLYDRLFPQGWRLKLLRRHVIGTSILYTAFFVPGTDAETPLYDKPYAEYRACYDKLWPQGWRLRLLDVVSLLGQPSYTAIWEPSTAGEVQRDVITYQQLKEEYDRRWPDGWRLHQLSTYKASGGQITAVWKQTNQPEIWFHGMEYAEFRARYDVLWEQGWRLKLLERLAV